MVESPHIARIPLSDCHRSAGGSVTHIAGWETIDFFDPIAVERSRVATTVGLADLSGRLKLQWVGPRARDAMAALGPAAVDGDRRPCWLCSPWSSGWQLLVAQPTDDMVLAIDLSRNGILRADWPRCVASTGSLGGSRDVSGWFAVFELLGPGTESVLRLLTPVDVSERAMPPGSCAATGLARVPAVLLRPHAAGGSRVQIWCSRECAEYLWEILLERVVSEQGGPIGDRAWPSMAAGTVSDAELSTSPPHGAGPR